jgi:hypothetical protein
MLIEMQSKKQELLAGEITSESDVEKLKKFVAAIQTKEWQEFAESLRLRQTPVR